MRDACWAVSVHSTINRAHQHATNLPRYRGAAVLRAITIWLNALSAH